MLSLRDVYGDDMGGPKYTIFDWRIRSWLYDDFPRIGLLTSGWPSGGYGVHVVRADNVNDPFFNYPSFASILPEQGHWQRPDVEQDCSSDCAIFLRRLRLVSFQSSFEFAFFILIGISDHSKR